MSSTELSERYGQPGGELQRGRELSGRYIEPVLHRVCVQHRQYMQLLHTAGQRMRCRVFLRHREQVCGPEAARIPLLSCHRLHKQPLQRQVLQQQQPLHLSPEELTELIQQRGL